MYHVALLHTVSTQRKHFGNLYKTFDLSSNPHPKLVLLCIIITEYKAEDIIYFAEIMAFAIDRKMKVKESITMSRYC